MKQKDTKSKHTKENVQQWNKCLINVTKVKKDLVLWLNEDYK